MNKILLAAASCAAALAVFLIYITLDGGSQRQLNLWYAQDCIPAPVMEELAEEYGSRSGDDSCRIILRSFASEAELAAAFEQERPDLLLCSSTRAASLGSRGLLDAVEAVELPDKIGDIRESGFRSDLRNRIAGFEQQPAGGFHPQMFEISPGRN